MLGRQQIAGIPTAISELFKNAHDAYADRAEVDYYRNGRLLVVRDDGLGMTCEDFEDRWLTLGTESKVAGPTALGPPPNDPKKPLRAILGEKGIGRLAIAAIGPQVLILSRAERDGQLKDLVAAYIHWGLFELPGVNLDEIEIPVRTFPVGTLPNPADLREMLNTVEANLALFGNRVDSGAAKRIRDNLLAMRKFDPEEIESYVPDLDLRFARGTHFLILPADDVLEADLDTGNSADASSLEKLLVGFTDSMTPNHPSPVISTAFRDHTTDEGYVERAGEDRFFLPSEFANADHYIYGWFDQHGQFLGRVSVYGDITDNYIVPWPGAKGRMSSCGPFAIHLAAIQPELKATTLPPEEHARLTEKTNKFGGLYIYREGIRLLPYGDVDYDWLEIEKRRSSGATYYYFSHRNMFGAILLSQENNASLTEKAGREGFRENVAYRQLRDILKNFLLQVAGDYFREKGVYSDRFRERKAELDRQYRALEKRRKHAAERKRALGEALERFFAAYDRDEPSLRALELAEMIESELSAVRDVTDLKQAASLLLEIEGRARSELRSLEASYRITKPRGIGLNQKLIREYQHYEEAYSQLQEGVFAGVRSLIEGEVTAAAEKARVELDRRIRIARALAELADIATRKTRSERSDTQGVLERVRIEVRSAARERQVSVEEVIRSTLARFSSTDVQELSDESLVSLRDTL